MAKADSVIVLEGEKDADSTRDLGFTAACNPGGAGKWRPEYSEVLRGKRVAIIADADRAGIDHAHRVATSLVGIAQSVRLIETLPHAAKDSTEWGEKGGTREALLQLVETTPECKGESRKAQAESNPSDEARHLGEFLAGEEDVDCLEPPVVARQPITEIFSPRGLGKSM